MICINSLSPPASLASSASGFVIVAGRKQSFDMQEDLTSQDEGAQAKTGDPTMKIRW